MHRSSITHSAEETKKVAKEFSLTLAGGDIILLEGNLGSGKTTFTQGILEALGAKKPYTSPTFVIMKTYEVKGKGKREKGEKKMSSSLLIPYPLSLIHSVSHIDTYRIESKDLLNLGWEEMIQDKNSVILLEWPERVRDILPQSARTIQFEHKEGDKRKISFLS